MIERLNIWLRRLGHIIASLINKASLYRFTDDALILSASISGIVVGLSIVVYHKVLELVEIGLRWLQRAEWGDISWTALTLPFITALGGLAIGLLKRSVFRDVHHHGLASVTADLRDDQQPLTLRHAAHAMVLSSISIASGGGAGREAPTVVLGAAVSSALARLGQMSPKAIRILGASGAAAAISGIFNAPLGGILFAVEAITGELRARTFIPIVIASVMATTTVRTILGNHPLLVTPLQEPLALLDYPLLALAGVLSAFVAAYHLRTYRWTYAATYKTLHRFPEYLRPMFGGFAAGVPLIILPMLLETSYQPVNDAIAGNFTTVWYITILLAIATIIIKPITNAVTLASGGEGGTFAPVLKVGALFGFCLGFALDQVAPTPVGLYAVVCAASVLAGTYRAPLTGAILLFEISGNYGLLLPLLFSSVVAVYIIRRLDVGTFNPVAE
ncbi:MAG: chloride channel protein [Ignavibacteriae bacterium]|nr:MAG: chloride channel protein [Ignavibacteriota bacterium]